MAEIQRGVVIGGKRSAISRVFHSKNDQETIAAWRLDLNRILHIFNVRSITSAWPSLTVHFQTELAIDTNLVVSDVHQRVVNTHTITKYTHTIAKDTHTIVSDIHRTMVQGQEGTDSKDLSVSVTYTLSTSESTLTIP